MLAYATKLTRDRAAAEDVLQETLVRAWLLTVAGHIVVDRARATAARPKEVAESPAQPPLERDHADQVIESMDVFEALQKLSEEHREVLVQCTGFPQSDDHNERVFLHSVHACELVFYLVRWIACRTTLAINAREPDAAFWLDQVATCTALLTGIFHVLKTLSPQQFMNFRDATGAASAVQSMNFHLMEIAVYGYDPRKAEVFDKFRHLQELNNPPFRHHRSLREAVLAASDPRLTAAFATVERILLTWRGKHY